MLFFLIEMVFLIKAPVDSNNKPKSIKTHDQIEWIEDIENICSFYTKKLLFVYGH